MLVYEVKHTYIYVYIEKLRLYILCGEKMLAKENVLQRELSLKMVFFLLENSFWATTSSLKYKKFSR